MIAIWGAWWFNWALLIVLPGGAHFWLQVLIVLHRVG